MTADEAYRTFQPPFRRDEEPYLQAVEGFAALGGWHGFRIRRSHGVLEGVHSRGREFPRGTDHDDSLGWPDLFLVNPEREEACAAEIKGDDGDERPEQKTQWRLWLPCIKRITTPVWYPRDERAMREYLAG